LLLNLIEDAGPKWKQIAAELPNDRTPAMVRNRFLRIKRGRWLTEQGQSKNRCGICGQLKRGHVCLSSLRRGSNIQGEDEDMLSNSSTVVDKSVTFHGVVSHNSQVHMLPVARAVSETHLQPVLSRSAYHPQSMGYVQTHSRASQDPDYIANDWNNPYALSPACASPKGQAHPETPESAPEKTPLSECALVRQDSLDVLAVAASLVRNPVCG